MGRADSEIGSWLGKKYRKKVLKISFPPPRRTWFEGLFSKIDNFHWGKVINFVIVQLSGVKYQHASLRGMSEANDEVIYYLNNYVGAVNTSANGLPEAGNKISLNVFTGSILLSFAVCKTLITTS